MICLFSVSKATGQMLEDVRINEIQVINNDGYKDAFGHAVPWIELFNTGYGEVNIGGAILKVNGKEYNIPRAKDMVIPTRGYVIFFASGETDKGPYYTNFTLDNTNFIELYAPDNKEVPIDRLSFNPSEMKEDVTYGWFKDESGVEKVMILPVITPKATNNTLETIHRSELFRQADPSGSVLTITAVAVVGLCLFLLYLIFYYMGKLNMKVARKREERAQKALAKATNMEVKVKAGKEDVLTDEEIAAIAIALFKYSEDLHDIEDTVLTINRAAKAYSPWSSKIYGLRQSLIKK